MGLFNFLYKLTNIFSNKRKLKVFIVLGIILFIVFSWSSGVFAVTGEEGISLSTYQIYLQESVIQYLRDMYTQKPTGFDINAFNSVLSRMRYSYFYVETATDTYTIYNIIFYNPNNANNRPTNFTVDGTYSIGLNSGTEYNCKLGLITPLAFSEVKMHGNASRSTPTYSTNVTDRYMPSDFYCIRSTYVTDFLSEFGYYDTLKSTYNTSDEELQVITQSGFNNLNNSINNQTNQMTNSINSATNSITNSVDNLNNTITDTTTDDSQVEFAQDSNQDITSGFFTGLYNSFETAFVDTSYKYVSFPIPFTGKVITFSSSYVLNNIKRNEKFSTLVTLAESFWWFALGYFVLLDIYKKINAIKSGDLTNIENDNITTDLL